MTLSMIFLIGLAILALLSIVLYIFLSLKKKTKEKSPHTISFVILGLLIIQWVLYLTNVYSLLPVAISDLLFLPIWIVLCIAGFLSAVYEFKNNKGFSLLLVNITAISFCVSLFIYAISKM